MFNELFKTPCPGAPGTPSSAVLVLIQSYNLVLKNMSFGVRLDQGLSTVCITYKLSHLVFLSPSFHICKLVLIIL